MKSADVVNECRVEDLKTALGREWLIVWTCKESKEDTVLSFGEIRGKGDETTWLT